MKPERKYRIIAGLLLSLLAGYMGCVMAFTHVHVVDGVLVTHSHPLSHKVPHQHEKNETILIYSLSHYLAIPLNNSDFHYISTDYHILESDIVCSQIPELIITSYSLRAPPFLLS